MVGHLGNGLVGGLQEMASMFHTGFANEVDGRHTQELLYLALQHGTAHGTCLSHLADVGIAVRQVLLYIVQQPPHEGVVVDFLHAPFRRTWVAGSTGFALFRVGSRCVEQFQIGLKRFLSLAFDAPNI